MKVVNYKIAKMAKSCGHDRLSSRFLSKNYYNPEGILNGDCIEDIKAAIVGDPTKSIPAPYQCELRDWIRTEYGVDIDIESSVTLSTISKVCYSWTIKRGSDGYSWFIKKESPDSYKDYDDALEGALEESLIMIKNERNQ